MEDGMQVAAGHRSWCAGSLGQTRVEKIPPHSAGSAVHQSYLLSTLLGQV
jgi:hypothetical protein